MSAQDVSQLLERLAGRVDAVDVTAIAAGARRREYRRRVFVAFAVTAMVLAAAIVVIRAFDGGGHDVRTAGRHNAGAAIGLADDGAVWPAVADRPDEAFTLANAFAVEVLDWPDAHISFESEPGNGPVWVTIMRAESGPSVRALAAPLSGKWAFMQIGDGIVLQRLSPDRARLETSAGSDVRDLAWWAKLNDGRELGGLVKSGSYPEVPSSLSSVRSAVVIGRDARGMAVAAFGGAYGRSSDTLAGPPAAVPDIVGRTVADARRDLESVGFTLGVDRDLDSDESSATVVAQEPRAGARVARGAVVGVRTAAPRPAASAECTAAATVLHGSPDGVPARGQTDLATVRRVVDQDRRALAQTYRASRVLLAHRGGDVYRPDNSSTPSVEAANDYEIVIELSSPDACPAAPAAWNGVPLAFVVRRAAA